MLDSQEGLFERADKPPDACAGVSVVIPAHQRPVELRRAIAAVRAQEYAGPLEVVVVFDKAEPDESLTAGGERPVRVLRNVRTPGLAGARNTGILASNNELVAFCDDDDYWKSNKLAQQVDALVASPGAPLVTSAIEVHYDGRVTPRLAGTDVVTHDMLVRSRMSMLHSSTFLFRKSALTQTVGLVNEEIPGSQNEDWDLLLRYSQVHPVLHVDSPLVKVTWGKSSFFSRRWDTKIESSIWMLDQHSDVARHSRGAARLMGQIAFAYACSGHRRRAWMWAARCLRRDPLQWRGALAGAVAVVPPSGEYALGLLHRFGRGV
ncbi:glycosyltransferase family 2 protein [Ornithinimicrobium murale]|uniref:glycosyltransferase family 2 protein n=1 Tax=Ornithinimicrobium murale TaxID=1050153 RepID=UPI000E0DFBFE|nr:glycosyltransferase family 2 protein [Ornithinimicrobium murale]